MISCASRTGFNDPLNLSALKVEVCFLELLLGTEPAKPLCPNFYLNTRTKEGENKNTQCLLERENKHSLSLSLILSLPPSAFRKQRDRGELFSLNYHFPPVRQQLRSSVKWSWRWPFLTSNSLIHSFLVPFSPLFFFSSEHLKLRAGSRSLPECFIFSSKSTLQALGNAVSGVETLENTRLPLFHTSELLNLPRLSNGFIQRSYFIRWRFI